MIKIITPLDQVDSSAAFTVGTRTIDKSGNEYIYLPGTTSVAQYDWVTFTSASGSVVRLVANAKGQVGIAQGAIISNKFGWFGIAGILTGNCGTTTAAGGTVYSCGTTATVSNALTSGDLIAGAFSSAIGTGGSTGAFSLNYPFCTDTLS